MKNNNTGEIQVKTEKIHGRLLNTEDLNNKGKKYHLRSGKTPNNDQLINHYTLKSEAN